MANEVTKKEKKEKKDKKEKKSKRTAEDAGLDEQPAKKAKKSDAPTMDAAEVKKWREENVVACCDIAESFAPCGFADSGLPADVLKCTANFTKPTAIQAQSWPLIMANKDVVGIAKTGSGKTYAFMLPGLARAKNLPYKACHPQGLVLAPTRELCMQIAVVGEEAASHCGMRVVMVYGQTPKDQQRREIKKGANFVIATPGRLKDLLTEGPSTLSLSKVSYAVLDEADRMLDMGFMDDVREILAQTAKQRQMLMFSATWPTEVKEVAEQFLKKPARITIGSEGLAANHSITQIVEVIEDAAKYKRLVQLLTKYHTYEQKNRVIIFGLYKKEVARLEQQLWRDGWNCVAIQGDASQAAREESYRKFSTGESPLLIATDVAARGLDIKGVEYVLNCSFPLTVEDYVHRIGRTGRAGMTGHAHTFFTVADKSLAPGLIRVLEEAKQPVPAGLEKWRHIAPKKPPASAKNPLESKSGGFKGEMPTGGKEVFSDSDDE